MVDGPAKFDVGIIGLGYVGLTLATVLAEAGVSVVGVERRPEIVDLTNQGTPHFTETGLPDALEGVTRSGKLVAVEALDDSFTCDAYIITVGTPLSPEGVARIDMIESAARDIAANMQDGALVILRSTVKVGTTRDVVTVRVAFDGWPVELSDTAGLRDSGEALEAEGIARTKSRLASADLVVWVMDLTDPVPPPDGFAGIVVGNKADLTPVPHSTGEQAIPVSAVTRAGIPVLRARAGGNS